jgi:hypothetical protein
LPDTARAQEPVAASLKLQKALVGDAGLQRELRLAHEELARDRQAAQAKAPKAHSRKPADREGQQHLQQRSAKKAAKAVALAHRSEKAPSKRKATPSMVSLDADPGKVQVTIYMESLCPACRKYTTTYLKQVLEAPGVGKIIDLRVVPFGNADATDAANVDIKYNTTELLKPLLMQMESPWADPVCLATHRPSVDSLRQRKMVECVREEECEERGEEWGEERAHASACDGSDAPSAGAFPESEIQVPAWWRRVHGQRVGKLPARGGSPARGLLPRARLRGEPGLR